jgi:hypothetical protein
MVAPRLRSGRCHARPAPAGRVVTTKGPTVDLKTHVHEQMVRTLVGRCLGFCPISDQQFDVRNAVVLLDEDGDPAYVLAKEGWRVFSVTDTWRELQGQGYTVDLSRVTR